MPCHGAPAVWAGTRTASLLAPSALVRIADRPSYHIIGSSYNMTIWLSSHYATAPVMKSTGRPKDRRQSARDVGRARWSEGNAGDRDWRPGYGRGACHGPRFARTRWSPLLCPALPYPTLLFRRELEAGPEGEAGERSDDGGENNMHSERPEVRRQQAYADHRYRVACKTRDQVARYGLAPPVGGCDTVDHFEAAAIAEPAGNAAERRGAEQERQRAGELRADQEPHRRR